CARQDSNFDSW
nr:immunoglobulin heavy chain junction region [Macaca mulatta]MOW97852.1 immunoglobulin heavy chain junction region [Macaca mulatta]